MTVRKTTGIVPFLLAFALLQPLGAQTTETISWSPDRPDTHAPLSISNDRTLMRNHFEVGIRYFNERWGGLGYGGDSIPVMTALNSYAATPTRATNQGARVSLMYGVTDFLTLSATGGFAHKVRTNAVRDLDDSGWHWLYGSRAYGLEDVEVSAIVKILDRGPIRVHLNGGMSVPLGSTDSFDQTLDPEDPLGTNAYVLLPIEQQLGSGGFDAKPGFTVAIQNEQASLNVQWQATVRVTGSDRGWTRGDRYEAAVWAGYKGSDWVSVTVGGLYSTWGNLEGWDNTFDAQTSLAYYNPSYQAGMAGSRVDVPLGINFIIPGGLFEGHRLAIEYLYPVTQELEFAQLRHDRTITMSWRADFGLF